MITERAPSKMKGGPGGYSHGRYCSCVFQPHCVHLPDSWQPEGRHHICRDRGSRIVKFGWNCEIGQNCEIWRKLWNLVNPPWISSVYLNGNFNLVIRCEGKTLELNSGIRQHVRNTPFPNKGETVAKKRNTPFPTKVGNSGEKRWKLRSKGWTGNSDYITINYKKSKQTKNIFLAAVLIL